MDDIIKQLLTTAKDTGRIEHRTNLQGGYVKIGNEDFGKDSERNYQKYVSALEEMENQGLVKGGSLSSLGQVFMITDKGYNSIGM